MSREEPRFRVVGPEDTIRRRPPGAAFLLVCLYAALFGGALWYLGARTGIWKKNARKVGATSAASVVPASEKNGRGDGATGGRGERGRGDAGTRTSQRASSAEAAASAAKAGSAASQSSARGRGDNALSRDALLAGQGLEEPARSRYFSRLATERCDCGCGRTLTDCLVNEKTCSRSPALADQIRKSEIGNR
jgi:hypothetical protein